MDGVGGCGCRLVWGRRGKAQVRELGRGQGNFKLAANFDYIRAGQPTRVNIVEVSGYCKTPLPSVWKKAQTIPIIF